jgi:hypothetical protein
VNGELWITGAGTGLLRRVVRTGGDDQTAACPTMTHRNSQQPKLVLTPAPTAQHQGALKMMALAVALQEPPAEDVSPVSHPAFRGRSAEPQQAPSQKATDNRAGPTVREGR